MGVRDGGEDEEEGRLDGVEERMTDEDETDGRVNGDIDDVVIENEYGFVIWFWMKNGLV